MADKIKSLLIDETLRFAESGTNVAKSGAYLYPVKVNKHTYSTRYKTQLKTKPQKPRGSST